MAIDVILALSLVGVGWQALAGRDLYRSIIVFLAFGVLLAVTWARLDAPDLALAEAAIGAGLTGALFLTAAHRLGPERVGGLDATSPRARRRRWGTGLVAAVLALGTTAAVAHAILSLPTLTPGLRPSVAASLGASGVSNPVTAVLLNFRAYDTLLEIGVLLVAGIVCWATRGAAPRYPARDPHLQALVRFLTPLLVITAGYLLWSGSFAPGGAFQAGALLAGGGVLRVLLGKGIAVAGWRGRALAVVGLGVFLGVGAGVLLSEPTFLQLPPPAAGALILAIEAASSVSVGYLLMAMYQGGRGEGP
jgi:multisubunit Na+/H+ antiporter MnhB subunit